MKRSRVGGAWRQRAAAAVLVIAAAALPATLAAQQPGTPQQRVIRVSGVGMVQATPDQAHVDFGVETFAANARAAGEENARAMDRVIRALTAAGIPRTDIQTRGYSLFPEYAQQDRPPMPRPGAQPEAPRIVGYRAINTVSVRTADLARVGQLIDAGLAAGANRLDGLRFSLRDAEAAQNRAIGQAAERARRAAEAMAAALGVRLGQLVEANTAAGMAQPFARMEAMAARDMAAMAPTPVEPGEQTVTASVSLVFAIQ